jgi:hypothetical protein
VGSNPWPSASSSVSASDLRYDPDARAMIGHPDEHERLSNRGPRRDLNARRA